MKPTLFQAHIGLTTKCNLNCTHCYSIKERIQKGETEISLEKLQKIFLRLKQLQTFKIIFAYSESLMYENFFSAVTMAKKFNFDVELTTNALLLTREVISKLKEARVDKIQISLDYPDKRHDFFRNYNGLFDIVSKALLNLKEIGGFRVRILSTQWGKDIDFYQKFKKIADDYQVDVIAFLSSKKYMFKDKEDVKQIISDLSSDKRFVFHNPYLTPQKCLIGKIIHINPVGDFTLCPLSNKIVGNITKISDDELSDILDKSSKMLCMSL